MPGQFLERPTLVDLGDFCLEALRHRGGRSPSLLILSPHPSFGGGSMDSALSLELSWASARRRHATLRFNWRGVGASQGEEGGLGESLEDARHALRLLEDDAPDGAVALAGCFFGSEVALALARERPQLAGVFLVAPALEDPSALASSISAVKAPVTILLAGKGSASPERKICHALEAAGASVEVIPEADASFSEGLVQMGDAVARELDRLGGCGWKDGNFFSGAEDFEAP